MISVMKNKKKRAIHEDVTTILVILGVIAGVAGLAAIIMGILTCTTIIGLLLGILMIVGGGLLCHIAMMLVSEKYRNEMVEKQRRKLAAIKEPRCHPV